MTPRPPTDRQREIWALYCKGLTKEEIGARLGISPGTVHNHIVRYAEKHRRPR